MAQRWIPVDSETPRKPEIKRMARALGICDDAVFGKCVRTWQLFDEQTTDGLLIGYTADDLDFEMRCDGFAEAMADVAWLVIRPDGLECPKFQERNGESAKQRAVDAKRKRAARRRAERERTEQRERPETSEPDPSSQTPASRVTLLHDAAAAGSAFADWCQSRAIDNPGGAMSRLCALSVDPADDAPTAAHRCQTEPVWRDEWFAMFARASPDDREAARVRVLWWYRRQLGAPDPLVSSTSAAVAACVVALAETVARSKNTTPGLFFSLLKRGDVRRLDVKSRAMVAAAKLVEQLIDNASKREALELVA